MFDRFRSSASLERSIELTMNPKISLGSGSKGGSIILPLFFGVLRYTFITLRGNSFG